MSKAQEDLERQQRESFGVSDVAKQAAHLVSTQMQQSAMRTTAAKLEEINRLRKQYGMSPDAPWRDVVDRHALEALRKAIRRMEGVSDDLPGNMMETVNARAASMDVEPPANRFAPGISGFQPQSTGLLDRIKRGGSAAMAAGTAALSKIPPSVARGAVVATRVAGEATPWLAAGVPIAGAAYKAATDGVSDRGVGRGPVRAATGFLREVGDRALPEAARNAASNVLTDAIEVNVDRARKLKNMMGLRRQ
jgi:hypothetical protein